MNNLTLADIVGALPPQSREFYDLMSDFIERDTLKCAGNNQPFRIAVGDQVEDFFGHTPARPVGKVLELYRENGHNKILTTSGAFRECDLRRI